jgi:recombination protein RecA
VGNHVKVKIAKNKLAPPFRIAEFDIIYGEGISKNGEIIDMGVDLDIIDKSGAWYGYGGSKIAQGREAAKQFLADNPELALEIEQKIKGRLLNIPVNGNTAEKSTPKGEKVDAK